jgi:hypothetical protein
MSWIITSIGPARASFVVVAALCLVACAGGGGESCGECVAEKCSDLVAYCDQDPGCACLVECLGDNGIPGVEGCLADCGLSERPPAFVPVEECVAIACPDEGDECSTPSGYEPPAIASSDDTSDLEAHGGGGDLADCGFDDGLSFDPDGPVLQLESQNGNVCVRLERENLGAGSLANTEWRLLELRAGPLGGVALVDDPADLCWYSSHHNFLDWAHAWTGAVRYDLKLREDMHGGARTYALHAYEQGPVDPGACAPISDGATPIGDPITMYPFDP